MFEYVRGYSYVRSRALANIKKLTPFHDPPEYPLGVPGIDVGATTTTTAAAHSAAAAAATAATFD